MAKAKEKKKLGKLQHISIQVVENGLILYTTGSKGDRTKIYPEGTGEELLDDVRKALGV